MSVNNVVKKRVIMGMYISDKGDLYNNTPAFRIVTDSKFKDYLPFLELIQFKPNETIKFVDGKNKDNEIVTHNSLFSGKRLSPETIRRRKLDVTQNDLILGSVDLVLNLTGYNITMEKSQSHRQVFPPVENTLLDPLKGSVYIISCHNYNNPGLVNAVHGYSNYFQTLIEKAKLSGKPSSDLDILEWLNDHWNSVTHRDSMLVSNTIKVFTCREVSEQELIQHKTIRMLPVDCIVSLENIGQMPIMEDNILNGGTEDLMGRLYANSFICYIVDNNDLISDRYINIAGSVKKVPKEKKPNQVNGLYMIHLNADGTPSHEQICSLEELEKSQYVFKSIEEATRGADLKTQYRETNELLKAENELLKQQQIRENTQEGVTHQKTLNELAQLAKEQELKYKESLYKLEADARARENERELMHKKELAELKKQFEDNKVNNQVRSTESSYFYDMFKYNQEMRGMETKSYYQEQQYGRDSTLETIKTVAAIAGLSLGVWTIANKMNSKS